MALRRKQGRHLRQLDMAKRTVEEAGKRTRAAYRKLREVETLGDRAPAVLWNR